MNQNQIKSVNALIYSFLTDSLNFDLKMIRLYMHLQIKSVKRLYFSILTDLRKNKSICI